MIRICFHGAESTGKTVLASELSERLRCPWVPEYGRDYAERHGTHFTMDDLLAIAQGQDAAMQAVCRSNPPVVLLDTDPLMTAAWAIMLFGNSPDELFAYPKAEHYLLFAPDTQWRDDGTRMFGTAEQRARFADIVERVLLDAAVPFTRISGDWSERRRSAIDTIKAIAGE